MSREATLTLFVFAGALLLFGLEPMVGKLLLPRFGGSFTVWTACLTYFQGVLLLAYLYCHLLARRLGWGHAAVVALPLLCLPIATPGEADPHAPLTSIAWTLTLGVGAPFFALATTSVVAQQWLAATSARANPYRLYAASNLGSLLALLAYPALVEPFSSLRTQRLVWSGLYGAYVVLALVALARVARGPTPGEPGAVDDAPEAPPGDDRAPAERGPAALYWFLLSAIPSAFLLATTNVVTVDVGSFPLMWVLPLAIYLVSFVAAFRGPPWCPALMRRFWLELSLVGVYYSTLPVVRRSGGWALFALIAFLAILLCVSTVAHRELYRLRPEPRRLTAFYLTIAFGGWVGGLAVSVGAPLVFTELHEYPLAIAALAATLLAARWETFRAWCASQPKFLLAGSAAILLAVPSLLASSAAADGRLAYRNFYGLYKLNDTGEDDDESVRARFLIHGTTIHGLQLLDRPEVGTAYYGSISPVCSALDALPRPRRLAVVGLGAGTLAAATEPGDSLTFFELDPDGERIARREFTFLAAARGAVDVVIGDARLALGHVPDGAYDALVVDAFSSDAIPTHLVTREALALYVRKLRPGGLLLFHISSRFYALAPVLTATGRLLGLEGWAAESDWSAAVPWEYPSAWFGFAQTPAARRHLRAAGWGQVDEARIPAVAPWTDDYVNVLGAAWAHRRETAGD